MKSKITIMTLMLCLAGVISDAQWSAVGTGVSGGEVLALTTYNGTLIAGGSFTKAGGNPASYIAAWNGTTWSALGAGTNATIYALTVYNGNLYAGGSFTTAGGNSASYIAMWNGTTWTALGSGTNGIVYALTVYNGNLYAGGNFTKAGGNSANYVAEWNGTTWTALSSGISNVVYALATYNSNLYAGGSFQKAGGHPATNIAEWNGTSWDSLKGGVFSASGGGYVYALATCYGNLYVGGEFGLAGNSSYPAYNIAAWNSTAWSMLGSGGGLCSYVYALADFNSSLYIGGTFSCNYSGESLKNIAEWNGSGWDSLSSGVNAQVNALAAYNGNLYAGGWFNVAGGISASYIAEWGNITTGITDIERGNGVINVYPNPSYDIFNLDLEKESDIRVYDVMGQMVFHSTLPQGHNQVHVEGSQGLYILNINGVCRKIIKQ